MAAKKAAKKTVKKAVKKVEKKPMVDDRKDRAPLHKKRYTILTKVVDHLRGTTSFNEEDVDKV